GETAAHMGDRLQPHVLRGFGRQHRTQSAGVMKDELLVALEDRLRVGTRRVDPEFQHAAGTENAPGMRPSRSISRGSRMSTITTSSLCAAVMASAALTVSISALA